MSRIAVVPGSFDPITHGHLDIIRRATAVFEEVHVVVVHNPDKTAMLPIAERVRLIQEALEQDEELSQKHVQVASWSMGLLVDYCLEVGATVLVKGIRSQIDVAYETPMVIMNRSLAGVETVFFLTEPQHAHVSSSLVRQVASLGGDVSPYVPEPVVRALDALPRDRL